MRSVDSDGSSVDGTTIIGLIDFFFSSLVECCSVETFKNLKHLQLVDHQIDDPELLPFGYIAESTARKSAFPMGLISHKLFPVHHKQQLVLVTILKHSEHD